MQDFRDKVAVITGAGSGFGREFARIGVELGMRVVLADVQADALAQVEAELRAAGGAIDSMTVDVADNTQVARLAHLAYERCGDVHLLFNNAGVGGGGYLWESSETDWQWVIGVNLMGVVHGIRHFVPRMLTAEQSGQPAHIVNTASMAGYLCPPLMGVYNVSKHAVVALTETLYHDLQLAQSRIGVSVLCPAFVPTGIAQSQRNRPASLRDEGGFTASQRAAQSQVVKAVAAGKVTARDVALLTFDAIRANRFHIFSHPQILPSLRARFDSTLAQSAPADPFAGKTAVRPGTPL